MTSSSQTYRLQLQLPRRVTLTPQSFETSLLAWFTKHSRSLKSDALQAQLLQRSRCAITATLDLVSQNIVAVPDAIVDLIWSDKEAMQADLMSAMQRRRFALAVRDAQQFADPNLIAAGLFHHNPARHPLST